MPSGFVLLPSHVARSTPRRTSPLARVGPLQPSRDPCEGSACQESFALACNELPYHTAFSHLSLLVIPPQASLKMTGSLPFPSLRDTAPTQTPLRCPYPPPPPSHLSRLSSNPVPPKKDCTSAWLEAVKTNLRGDAPRRLPGRWARDQSRSFLCEVESSSLPIRSLIF